MGNAEQSGETPEDILATAISTIRQEKGYDKADDQPGGVEKAGEAGGEDQGDASSPDSGAEAPKAKAADAESGAIEGHDSLIVAGDSEEEVEQKISKIAEKLGLDDHDRELLTQANFKKRWKDTRDHLSNQGRELAELRKKLEQLEQTPQQGPQKRDDSPKDDSSPLSDDMFSGLPQEVKAILEDTPELVQLFKVQESRHEQKAKKLIESVLAEREQVQAKAVEKQTMAQREQGWREGIEKTIPGGLELYQSPEFIDWETANANRLKSMIGHYDKFDPVGTIEEIRLYQKEKGLLKEAKAKSLEAKKESRNNYPPKVGGRSSPAEFRKGEADDGDLDAHYRAAVEQVRREKGYNTRPTYAR